MDGDDALRIIAPNLDEVTRKKLMKAQANGIRRNIWRP
jgi:hypothetical protein